jgi:hypothetical protein
MESLYSAFFWTLPSVFEQFTATLLYASDAYGGANVEQGESSPYSPQGDWRH